MKATKASFFFIHFFYTTFDLSFFYSTTGNLKIIHLSTEVLKIWNEEALPLSGVAAQPTRNIQKIR